MGTLDNTQRGEGGNLINKYNIYTHIEHSPLTGSFIFLKNCEEENKTEISMKLFQK